MCNCTPLAAYRIARGLSQPEAVERYQQHSGEKLCQPSLSRLEQWPGPGSRTPTAIELVGLSAVYDTKPIHLVPAEAFDDLAAHDRERLLSERPLFTAPSLDRSADGRLQRRPVPPPETVIATAARTAMLFTATHEAIAHADETIETMRAEISRLGVEYLHRAPASIAKDLAETQQAMFQIVNERRRRPAQAMDLYLLTGAVTLLLAEAAHHLGDAHAALTHTRTAYVCAQNAGNSELRAWTRGWQSLISYWEDRPHDALRFAADGVRFAGRGAGTIWLPALQARAQAMLGDARSAQASIDAAAEARERLVPGDLDALGGTFTLSPAWQSYLVADALVWLDKRIQQAVTEAERSLALSRSSAPTEQSYAMDAGARAVLGLALVRRRDIGGARAALAPVLALPPSQRIGGVLATVVRTHSALGGSGGRPSSTGKVLQQELEQFLRAPASAGIDHPSLGPHSFHGDEFLEAEVEPA